MKKSTIKMLRLFAAVLCLLLTQTYLNAQALKVLIVGSPATHAWNSDVKRSLLRAGNFSQVDIFQADSAELPFSLLKQYQAALVYTDRGFFDRVAMSDTLFAYVNAGGGIVTATFANTSGYFTAPFDSAYEPLLDSTDGNNLQRYLGKIYNPNSPLLKNVDSFDGGTSSYRNLGTILNPKAFRVADWSDSIPLITELDSVGPKYMTRVDVNVYPVSDSGRVDMWVYNTSGAAMLANALEYVASPLPPAVAKVQYDTVCTGETDTLWAKGVKGIAYWYKGSAHGTYVDTGRYIVVSPTVKTKYFVQNNFQNVFSINSDSVTIAVNTCTGINTISGLSGYISIYPNPSNGAFNIATSADLGKTQIDVMDITGRLIYSSSNNLNAEAVKQVNLNAAPGLYIVKITANGQTTEKKISVE